MRPRKSNLAYKRVSSYRHLYEKVLIGGAYARINISDRNGRVISRLLRALHNERFSVGGLFFGDVRLSNILKEVGFHFELSFGGVYVCYWLA